MHEFESQWNTDVFLQCGTSHLMLSSIKENIYWTQLPLTNHLN